VNLSAQLEPNTAKLGDILTLSVQSNHPPGQLIQPPALPKSLGTFEVYASTVLPVEVSNGVEIQRFQVALQNFTTGQQTLPGLTFSYQGADKKPRELKTPELKVTIEMVPAGPKDKGGDIRGIKGVIGPFGISPMWWWLLVFALVVGAAAYWSHRRRAQQGPPPEPPVPPDITALATLQELLASGWIEEGKIKEFYIAVSDAVRTYIEAGFKCPALERTTAELMRDLRARNLFASDQRLILKQLLEECDLVKFAKFRPEAGESVKIHALAVSFVEKTRGDLNAIR